jgi:hypothetical protein
MVKGRSSAALIVSPSYVSPDQSSDGAAPAFAPRADRFAHRPGGRVLAP